MAVVVLALVVLLIATSFSTTTTAANRTPRLVEPLSAGGYRAYIVFLHFLPADQAPAGGGGLADMHDAAAHAAWHASFLPSTKTTDGRPRLLFSYSALGGFSALLTDDEAEVLAGKPGVSVVIPNGYSYQRTTRTPDFLGLATGGDSDSSVWEQTDYGAGGVVDRGIDTGHPSVADDDSLQPPPPRWRGSCEGFSCTKKLVNRGKLPQDEADGHGTHTATTAAGNRVAGVSINNQGLANGTASGMAPSAHIAVYKVCSGSDDADEEDGDVVTDGEH